MRRLIFVLVVLLAFTAAPAQVLNPLTRGAIGGIPECKNSRVFCAGKHTGAEYSFISGSTCSSPTSTPAAGSAMKAAKDSGLCSEATPCEVFVGPGVWNECVTIDGLSGVRLRGHGIDATIIRPTVVEADDVDGGVVKIGSITTTARSTTKITVSDMTVHNDAFPYDLTTASIEPAIQIGCKGGCPSNAIAPHDQIVVERVRVVANHYGIYVAGAVISAASPSITLTPPQVTIRDSEIFTGAMGVVMGNGKAQLYIDQNRIVPTTTFCEASSLTDLAEITGTVQSGSTGTVINLGSPASAVDGIYCGRKLTMSGASCNITDHRENEQQITIYDGDAKQATVNSGYISAPNTSCTWTIASVPNSGATGSVRSGIYPRCATDWTTIRAQPNINNMPGLGGIALRTTGTAANVGDFYLVRDNLIELQFSDSGDPAAGDVCGDLNEGTSHNSPGLYGIMLPPQLNGGLARLEDNQIRILIAADHPWVFSDPLVTTQTCMPAVGIFVAGTDGSTGTMDITATGSVYIENRGDPDIGLACAASGAGAAHVLNLPNLACKINNAIPTSSSTAAAGAANTVTLNASEPTTVDFYKYTDIRMTSGACSGQSRDVMAYSSGRVATVAPPWASCTPGSGDGYTVGYLGHYDKNTGTAIYGKSDLLQAGTGVIKIGSGFVTDSPRSVVGALTLLGGGTSTGTSTMDFASAAAGACSATQTMTVPGAVDGDSCALGVPNASKNAAGSQFMCWVSTANTVTVSHCCENGTCDPASGTFRATVTRQ